MDVRSPVGSKHQLGVCSEHGSGSSANHWSRGSLTQLASNNTKKKLDSDECKGEIIIFG